MISYLVFLPMRGVALPILMGLGKPGLPTIGFLVAGVLNLGLSILFIGPLGLAGVALGTAIPNVLFGGLVVVQACRELGTPVAAYLRYVVPRAIVGALPVLALLLWLKVGLGVRTLTEIAAAGVAMVVVFGAIWVFYVYRDDPYVDLRNYLPGLRVRQKESA
jgi:O-antigen/teichoic acid export membrane protein